MEELQNLHELSQSLKRNGNVEGLLLPDFKTCYKATVTMCGTGKE